MSEGSLNRSRCCQHIASHSIRPINVPVAFVYDPWASSSRDFIGEIGIRTYETSGCTFRWNFVCARYFPRTCDAKAAQANLSWKRKEKRVWESLCESESEKWWLLVLVTASSKKVSTHCVDMHINMRAHTHVRTYARARAHVVDAYTEFFFLLFEYIRQHRQSNASRASRYKERSSSTIPVNIESIMSIFRVL